LQRVSNHTIFIFLSAVSVVESFPQVPVQKGSIDPEPLFFHRHDERQNNCLFNAKQEIVAAYNEKSAYTGARISLPGTGKGGIKVPADGDPAHAFKALTVNDIRGPSPGLNAAANMGILTIFLRTSTNNVSRFEADASSLTSNEYFTDNSDHNPFNSTLLALMNDVDDRVSNGNLDQKTMATYKSQRYESITANSNFF
jgi:hypothetical protein